MNGNYLSHFAFAKSNQNKQRNHVCASKRLIPFYEMDSKSFTRCKSLFVTVIQAAFLAKFKQSYFNLLFYFRVIKFIKIEQPLKN